jgi:alpha-tubulin suppressor-like RCC1 family protein
VFGCADVSKENQLQTGCSEGSESTPENQYVSPAPAPTPEPTPLASVIDVSSGGYSSCAVISDGLVKCWGWNQSGQLGDGTTTNRLSPVAVAGLTNVGKISVGSGTHTCSLINDGSVKCWGRNYHAQLGIGSSGRNTPQSTPVSTSDIYTATGVTSYNNFSCAILSNENIKCWGLNNDAQIGDGTVVFDSSTYERKTPTNVIVIGTATAISSGVDHSCALLADKTLKCWGSNNFGQLGIGEISNRSSTPLTVIQN